MLSTAYNTCRGRRIAERLRKSVSALNTAGAISHTPFLYAHMLAINGVRVISHFAATRSRTTYATYARTHTQVRVRVRTYESEYTKVQRGKRSFESTRREKEKEEKGERGYRSSSTRQSGPNQFHSEVSKQGFSSPEPSYGGFPLYTEHETINRERSIPRITFSSLGER